eukprot:938833-Prymnesium_polylepis.3
MAPQPLASCRRLSARGGRRAAGGGLRRGCVGDVHFGASKTARSRVDPTSRLDRATGRKPSPLRPPARLHCPLTRLQVRV